MIRESIRNRWTEIGIRACRECGLVVLIWVAVAWGVPGPQNAAAADTPRRPNVILIMADDQGFGDLSLHGNTKLQTPHLDTLAAQGIELTDFHVSPVCAPTRASLMTGRYHYRTRVVDTAFGRAMMDPAEITLAEMLGGAGYQTGIFGKWHLGDNYPLRPMDQGFGESLVLRGGGIGQPSDPPGGSSYFDPILLHNGQLEKTSGYCSDVYTRAAVQFIERHQAEPFFVYLAFNAPHTPLEVPDEYRARYSSMRLDRGEFPNAGFPLSDKIDQDTTARVYGMVANIDDNVGRLLHRLDELHLADDTIVVFLTDNGPQQERFKSGLRGLKGTVYEGGIRVPCFLRWPGKFAAGRKIDRLAAHIDLAPTLLAACRVPRPAEAVCDGRSLLPQLLGESPDWPDRTLYFQWHRGDAPDLNRACAARSQRWKIVQPQGTAPGPAPANPAFELYDMAADHYELHNVAAEHPEIVQAMRAGYEAWFREVGAARGYAPPRIVLGSKHENPVTLTRQDCRTGWGDKDVGSWEVDVAAPGDYQIKVTFRKPTTGIARLRVGDAALDQPISGEATQVVFDRIALTAGPAPLTAWSARGEQKTGAWFVDVRRIE